MSIADPDPSRTAAQPPRREPLFNIPAIVVWAIAVCAAIHLLRLYVLTADQDLALLLRAAFIPIRYSGQFDLDVYAFTSPVTYAFLHGGLVHLAINMVWLAAFGSPLANRLGPLRFALFWIATSIAAVALHYGMHPYDQSPLIGASGAISGMMAAAARFGFQTDRVPGRNAFAGPPLSMAAVLRTRNVVVFLIFWFAINLLTGLSGFVPGSPGQIAWEAHIGGFVAGFFGLKLFLPRSNRQQRRH